MESKYSLIIDTIDLNNWTKKKDILFKLNVINGLDVSERTFRKAVEWYNKGFYNHEHDKFIAHSRHGYKLTDDKEEIMASIQESKNRSLNMLWKYSRTMKALGEKDNIRMDLERMELM